MENTPTGCADDLPTILAIFKKYQKSRSVNMFSPAAVFGPKQHKSFLLPAKAPPS
jgi:hypothetical protein